MNHSNFQPFTAYSTLKNQSQKNGTIMTEKVNAKVGKKSLFFDENSKIQAACPPLPVYQMSWNLVCKVSITNLTIRGSDGLNLKKKFFSNNSNVQ